MPITSTGLGSGLDIESIITGLVDAEKAPVEQSILRQETEITETLTGFSQLRGVLGGLQTAAASLLQHQRLTRCQLSRAIRVKSRQQRRMG